MIQNPHRDFEIVDENGLMHPRFQGWVQSVTALLNLLDPIEGIGTPEGSLFADKKKIYIDTAAANIYYKTTDKTLNTGWILLG